MKSKLEQRPQLLLYGRNYCHLCQDMLASLEALRSEFGFELRQIDVDSDSAAEEKYDELVPVLTDASGNELCHYHLDEPRVRDYLGQFGLKLGQTFSQSNLVGKVPIVI